MHVEQMLVLFILAAVVDTTLYLPLINKLKMHIDITRIVIVLMPQHVSVLRRHLGGVTASFILRT